MSLGLRGPTNSDRPHAKSPDTGGGSGGGAGDWADPAYDNNGNMTTMPRPKSLANSYTGVYDGWNRLVEVKESSTVKQANEYDGLHRRIIRDESNGSGDLRHFYYSQQWQVLEERVGSASIAKVHYIYGPRYVDEMIFRDRDTNDSGVMNERFYYAQDANFNVTALIGNDGTALERCLYDPYGQVTFLTGAWGSRSSSSYDNEMLFTGRRVDPETGLQLNRYRFHHQQLGRWVTRDPVEYRGSEWSLYEYLEGNPMAFTDPSGRDLVVPDPPKSGPPSPPPLLPIDPIPPGDILLPPFEDNIADCNGTPYLKSLERCCGGIIYPNTGRWKDYCCKNGQLARCEPRPPAPHICDRDWSTMDWFDCTACCLKTWGVPPAARGSAGAGILAIRVPKAHVQPGQFDDTSWLFRVRRCIPRAINLHGRKP